MITIIKEGKGKTTSQKYRERIYIKKCWNCKSKFTYQNDDINLNCLYQTNEVKCPVCGVFSTLLIKRKYRKSRLEKR